MIDITSFNFFIGLLLFALVFYVALLIDDLRGMKKKEELKKKSRGEIE